MDLLEQVSEQVGFKYVIELVPDNNYGALNLSSGSWNGLVKGMSYVVPGSSQGRSWVVLESCRGSAGVVPGSFLGRAGIVLGLAGSCRVVQGSFLGRAIFILGSCWSCARSCQGGVVLVSCKGILLSSTVFRI